MQLDDMQQTRIILSVLSSDWDEACIETCLSRFRVLNFVHEPRNNELITEHLGVVHRLLLR